MAIQFVPRTPQSFSGYHYRAQVDEAVLPTDTDLECQKNGIPQPPPGFPATVEGPMAWSGTEITQDDLHVVELDDDDVAELERALEAFKELEMDGDDVTRERFPLPRLETRLDRGALEIHHGTGLCIVRGLDPERYSVEDNMILFLGISCYIGNQRGLQNARGDMISHVTDSKSWTVPRERRHGIHTNFALPFHCDMGAEILSMHVRQAAQFGGRTCVSSSRAIYNDLVRSCPWALRALAKGDWPIQTQFSIKQFQCVLVNANPDHPCHSSSKQKPPYTLSPLIEFHMGNLIMSVDPARVGPRSCSCSSSSSSSSASASLPSPRLRGTKKSTSSFAIPHLTTDQSAALAELQAAAQRHQVALESQAGDMIYLNNWALLHAREPYIDAATSSRHLVRLWLRNESLGWPIPTSMTDPWDAAFGEKAALVVDRCYALVPMPSYMHSKFTNGTAAFVAEEDDDEDVDVQDLDDDVKDESASASTSTSASATDEAKAKVEDDAN